MYYVICGIAGIILGEIIFLRGNLRSVHSDVEEVYRMVADLKEKNERLESVICKKEEQIKTLNDLLRDKEKEM